MGQALHTYSFYTWAIWAVVLVSQNFAFTMVSRARNSGSLQRHVTAAIFSNGIWIVSQFFIVSKIWEWLTGKHGTAAALAVGAFYTLFTVIGALSAHYYALKTEKGKASVGANKKYAQIPIEEWEAVRKFCLPPAPEPETIWTRTFACKGERVTFHLREEDFGYSVWVKRTNALGGSDEACLTTKPVAHPVARSMMTRLCGAKLLEGFSEQIPEGL